VLTNFRNIWRPNNYHGWGKKPPFFEGWYFKLVDQREQRPYAVIPGVFIGGQTGASHSFVQTLDGATGESTYHRYPYEAFSASRDEFDVWVGPNHFRADGIHLEIASPERTILGDLLFENLSPWPVKPLAPGIMGWYAFAPFMECYHGVVSLDHAIRGALTIDGQHVDFTGGHGYTEKDWGQSFPRAWVWMQTNHFEQRGTSFTASVAIIPWLRGAFNGFIVGLWNGGRLYRFATYTGATLEHLAVTDDHVEIRVADRSAGRGAFRLEVRAQRSEGGLLHSPERTAMLQRVMESLTATVQVRLIEQSSGHVVFEGEGKHAGLEVVGDLPVTEAEPGLGA
jgi:tocopherol cyclase